MYLFAHLFIVCLQLWMECNLPEGRDFVFLSILSFSALKLISDKTQNKRKLSESKR